MPLRPLPDLSDDAAMCERGRAAALRAALHEACSVLRDAVTLGQSDRDPAEIAAYALEAKEAAQRMADVCVLMIEHNVRR